MPRPQGHLTKHAGITKPATKITNVKGVGKRTTLTAGKQQKRKDQASAERQALIAALAPAERNAVLAMDMDSGFDSNEINFTFSPGEEGFDVIPEGDEEAEIRGLLSTVHMRVQPSFDPRTRRDREDIGTFYWDLQIEKLADAYLEFNHRVPDHVPSDIPPVEPTPGTLEVWDISARRTVFIAAQEGHIYINETLLSCGYLASCPLAPAIAFSVRILKIYRQVHRTCPRLSIDAFCRSLCNLINVPFPPYLAVQFSHAYDGYLFINRIVDRRVDIALGHDTPYWHVKNSCPACFYALDDEPNLLFSALVAMDGNNSLRRMGAAMHSAKRMEHVDRRTINSDWWISPEEVDKYKDEVQSSSSRGTDIPTDDQRLGASAPNEELPPSKCRDRWTNAGPEEHKRMLTLFDETGVFITSCRHRFVLFGCDMIKSGELYKYAFANVNRVLTILPPGVGNAYDVGCEFSGSLDRSTLVDLVAAQSLRMMCGAFHGYAHNRACQLDWHPLYIPGVGNFDGEGCEHIFSSSNDIARATRHASKFHRRQAIEEHFRYWNQDKYAVLSTYLVNHYHEAIKRINAFSLQLTLLNKDLKLTAEDFEADLNNKRSYFTELASKQTLESSLEASYVQALKDIDTHTHDWDNARALANKALTNVSTENPLTILRNARDVVDRAYERLEIAQTNVTFLEAVLKISERWGPEHPSYISYNQENIATTYRKVVMELERLVVLRFAELTKMSVPGLGYKLRRHIAKALVRRNEAIRRAIERYNTQAGRLDPPREPLTWKQIADTAFLGNFDVLKDIGLNIDSHPWTHATRRTAATAYFKVCRSQEEITRLNVEIRRLLTSIADEATTTTRIITALKATNPALAWEVNQRWTLRSKINQNHIDRLNALLQLPGFTGTLQIGKRRREPAPTPGTTQGEASASVSQLATGTNSAQAPQLTTDTNSAQAPPRAALLTRPVAACHQDLTSSAGLISGMNGREGDDDWEDINDLINDIPYDSVNLLSEFLAAM